jgi:hypothetical protein
MFMKKRKITTIEGLAIMMQKEFLTINDRFNQTDKNFGKLGRETKEIRIDMEDLKMRMGEVAFRFEIKELEKRIRKLELLYSK